MKVLRGNDVIINWTIRKLRGGIPVAEDFTNSTVNVFIVDSYGARTIEHSITGNIISIHIGGEIQRLGYLALDAYWEHNITKVNSRAKINDVVEFVDNPEDVDLNGLPDDIDIATTAIISDVYYGGEYIADFSKYYTKVEVDKLIIRDYNKLINIPFELTKDGQSYEAKKMVSLLYGGAIGNFVAGASGAYIDTTGNAEFETINVRKGILINGKPWDPGQGEATIDQKAFDKLMEKWFLLDENGDIRAADKGVNDSGTPLPRGLYSNSFVSAGGISSGGGGGTGGASTLGQLTNVGEWADATTDRDIFFVKRSGATHWSSMNISDIKVDLSNYYTKSEVNTEISGAVTPLSKRLTDHINDTVIHVTAAEKALWNKVAGWFAEDTVNKAIYVTHAADDSPRGFYTDGYVTAGGIGTSGGGSGGMDEDLLWSILGDGVNPDKQIAMSHLTVALAAYVTTTQMNTAINNKVKDYIPLSQKGVANGVVPLDGNALISSLYLPSYVDDVLEFDSISAFPATGERGKIYVALDSNLTYRWTGSQYTEISKSLALGETSETAYPGNKGKENRDSINALKRATFWGAHYQSDGNVYGEFNGTIIRLTDNLFTPKIKIGDIYIEYDNTNNGLKVVKYGSDGLEQAAGLYTTGYLTAGGIGTGGGAAITLDELYDVTITNPRDKQALVYDAASQKWINGASVGGGNISLNGTIYEAVNGLITLPNLYEKVAGGTASQFLKADGSVDNRLYALAYNNNQNKVLESNVSNSLHVIDRRDIVMLPTTFEDNTISTFFNLQSTPTNNWWSGIAVKGWSGEYGVWMLAGPAAGDNAGNRLYYKDGNHSNWATDWKGLAFLDDVKNIANVYFNGQDIYSDYGHWVVGLVRIGTAGIGDKFISGEMIYRRSNGIYSNGSVRFNLIKKYNSTRMFAGVFYTGYGIDHDQEAPRLCTFTYQGVKWGGLCWRSAASLNSIKTIIYDNSSTDTPFYVKYFNSQSSEIQNAEINNSISVLGSDIEVQSVSTNGRFYTSADRIEINNITNGWSYIRYRTNGRFYDVGLSGTTAGMAGAGNFEIRPNGSNNEGVFVRYYRSDYGKLGVVNKSGQQASIGYFNSNNGFGDKPIWTVGAGLRDSRSFDWWYGTEGYKMTLMEDGRLFINRRQGDAPSYSLSIGNNDTGLNWHQDGMITFMSKSKAVGHWNYSEGRLYNCYFREPTGNVYTATSMMVNGNGSNLYPGIGFHQPGVTAGVVYFTNSGEFKFRNINDNGYTNVYGGNLIADAGYLYSRYNGIEIKIGSENSSYVHFITNPARSLYFANSLFVNGGVHPYVTNVNDLGDAGHIWRNIYANRLIGEADKSVFLVPNYVGGQQANPQTYFNNGMGVKVAMTGVNPDSYWGDTLWINGYYGTNVPSLCALHFSRGGAPLMYISSQTYNATSYGTLYSVWTAYNSNKNDVAWACAQLHAYGRINANTDIWSNGWVRTNGTNGWYSESYGGGWHMTDSTWIRAYNGKQIYTASTHPDAIHTAGGINASGRIYAGSYIETHGGLVCAGVGNSGGASGFNVYASFYGNGQHGGIEIGASNNVFGIGVHSNDHMYWWWTNSGSVGSSSNKSYIMDYGGGSWSFTGNIYASGAITAGTTSDIRLKKDLIIENYSDKLLSLGKVFTFKYNDLAKSRKDKMVDDNYHIGLSYQVVKESLPCMAGLDKDGYGYLNYISPDFISLIAGAVQESVLRLNNIDDKVDRLNKDIDRLKEENKNLRREIEQLKNVA